MHTLYVGFARRSLGRSLLANPVRVRLCLRGALAGGSAPRKQSRVDEGVMTGKFATRNLIDNSGTLEYSMV